MGDLEPFLPPACPRGRKRRWPMRRIAEAIFHVLRTGCAWEMLPDECPPCSTVYRWFARFRDDGTWQTIDHHLVMRDRERAGRRASPTASVLDSQSVKTAEAGGPRGHDADKKIKGCKRHALVDADGRALKLHVHPADVQDRDGAVPLLRASRNAFPFIKRCFAGSAHAGARVASAASIAVEIVRKSADQIGFKVHKRRRMVERSFAWIGRNRRCCRDVERTAASAQAFLYAATAIIPVRKLGRCRSDSKWDLS